MMGSANVSAMFDCRVIHESSSNILQKSSNESSTRNSGGFWSHLCTLQSFPCRVCVHLYVFRSAMMLIPPGMGDVIASTHLHIKFWFPGLTGESWLQSPGRLSTAMIDVDHVIRYSQLACMPFPRCMSSLSSPTAIYVDAENGISLSPTHISMLAETPRPCC